MNSVIAIGTSEKRSDGSRYRTEHGEYLALIHTSGRFEAGRISQPAPHRLGSASPRRRDAGTNDPTSLALTSMPNDPQNSWPLPCSADHPEFDEILAGHLALRASRCSQLKRYDEAQESLEEALAALARVSDTRMRRADVAMQFMAEDR